ncbi:MAG: M28 family peptidase [Desulfobacteraceae bacterium]|nr:MAG: M28 family peptidase [Desulfobacteraceae bacterium]
MPLWKRLGRSLGRILILLAMALAGMWVAFARPIWVVGPAESQENIMPETALLRQHVEMLSLVFSPRDYRHPDNLNQTADYIRRHFEASGATVYEQSFVHESITYKNVMAEYGPSGESVIVVGAHYDAVVGSPGANDNASAVAGLLELARLFADASFSSRVILAAYTLEEPPFFGTDIMGSALHAKTLKEEGVDVRLMICLEMIGCFTDEPGSQKFPLPFLSLYYPTTGNFMGIVDKLFSTQAGRMKRWMRSATDLPVYSINAPAWMPGVDWSDHSSFWKQGYPAVMVTDTAFYRYDAYHTAADTPDRLNYAAMAKVVHGVYGYVMKLAAGRQK